MNAASIVRRAAPYLIVAGLAWVGGARSARGAAEAISTDAESVEPTKAQASVVWGSEKPHPEDIKACIRKRYGSVGAFAVANGVKPQAIADYLRGRSSKAIGQLVMAEYSQYLFSAVAGERGPRAGDPA